MILPNFAKNCIKLRKLWAVGAPLDPPLTVLYGLDFFGFWLQEEQLYMVVDFPDGGANPRVGPYAYLLLGTIFT